MTMKYVRDTYGIEIKRGQRVRVKAFDGWTGGRITSATNYVIIAPDKWPAARVRCHPTDRDAWQPMPHNAALRGDSGFIAGVPLESMVVRQNDTTE